MGLPELNELYAFLSERQTIADAQERVNAIYPRIKEAGDVKALRLAEAPYKKLQDEVRPTMIYVTSELHPQDIVQFHLSGSGPDATAWSRSRSAPILIEVTVASGKVRYQEMRALNETGIGHGFTNATDASSLKDIKARYDEYRAWDMDEALQNLEVAVSLCIERKARSHHSSRTLLVYVPLLQFLVEEWESAKPRLIGAAQRSPCEAVFLVCRALGGGDVCYRLR